MMSTGKLLEVAQRRVAGAEVVDGQPHAEPRAARAGVCRGALDVGHQHRLGDLQGQRGRVDAGVGDRRGRRRRPGPAYWNWRAERLTFIRRPAAAGDSARQRASCAVACRSTHRPSGTIRPFASALAMKWYGPSRPRPRMLPAHQRLDPGQPLRVHLDDRLVEDQELARAPAPARGRPAAAPPRAPTWSWSGRRSRTRSGRPLGRVHRQVGVAEQLLGGCRRRRSAVAMPTLSVHITSRLASRIGSRTTASRRPASAAASAGSRSAIRIANSSPPSRASMSPGRTWARSRSAIVVSNSSPALCPRLSLTSLKSSRSSSSRVTGAPSLSCDRPFEPLAEQGPVGHAGQRVGERLALQLGLEGPPAADVAQADHGAPAGPGRP